MRLITIILCIIFMALMIPQIGSCQTTAAPEDCNLETHHPMPTLYSAEIKPALTPDPCGAKQRYPGTPTLTCSPASGEQIIKFGIRIITETTINSDCESTTREISRDTFVISSEAVIGQNRTVGGGYIVQCELLTKAPKSRPVGFMATLLPKGDKYADYWTTHYGGEYATAKEATAAMEVLKTKYPEFCSAFVRKLPSNCTHRFEYR
jgi:hypothetical protein